MGDMFMCPAASRKHIPEKEKNSYMLFNKTKRDNGVKERIGLKGMITA